MSESDTRATFLKLLAPLDPHNIENLLASEAGMPDVEYFGGWCELKWIHRDKWPKRASTTVKIEHYTDLQRAFLLKRWNMGEACWLVLQSANEWFFWDAVRAQKVGTLTRAEMIETANYYLDCQPPSEVMCAILSRNKNNRFGTMP